jgi:hypothetical protein
VKISENHHFGTTFEQLLKASHYPLKENSQYIVANPLTAFNNLSHTLKLLAKTLKFIVLRGFLRGSE